MIGIRSLAACIAIAALAFSFGQAFANSDRCQALAASYNEPGIAASDVVLGPAIDLVSARAACEAAVAEVRTPENLFRLSRILFRMQEVEAARLLSLEGAEAGYPPAMAHAAYVLMFGIGGPADVKRGYDYAVLSDAAGDPTGTYYVGTAHELGLVEAVDIRKAADIYRRAADGGDYTAMTRLGWILLFVDPSLGSSEEAYTLLHRAAEKDYVEASTILADGYRTGTGRPQDLAAAASWYRRAADRNYAPAQGELSGMHLRGEPSGIDDVTALAFADAAASTRDGYANMILGHFLANGIGTDPDPEAAFAAWQKAYESGARMAGFELAEALIEGKGTLSDPTRAREILGEVAEADPQRAEQLMQRVYAVSEFERQRQNVLDFLQQEICEASRALCDGRVCTQLADGERAYATMDGHGWYVTDGRRVDISLIDPDMLSCFP